MKKFLSLVLCVIFALCLCACGDKSGKKDSHSVDVEYYAKLGQINEVSYKLGDDVDTTKETLGTAIKDDEDEFLYYDYTSGDYTVMTDGTVCCCYKTEDKSSGLTNIVKYGDAYGFNQGAISTEVRDTMADLGFTASEREAKSGELFFLPSSGTLTVLQYDFDTNTVLFVFEEHALSATVIYKR